MSRLDLKINRVRMREYKYVSILWVSAMKEFIYIFHLFSRVEPPIDYLPVDQVQGITI